MKISVIVPTYRRPQYLKRCLEALAKQSRKPDEVVVITRDDDIESLKIVDEIIHSGNTLPITHILLDRPGKPVALNAGIKAATGAVLCFTDDDAEAFPDWLERIERHFQDTAVGGVGGRDILVQNGKLLAGECQTVGRINWFGRYVGNHHLSLVPPEPIEADHLKGVNMALRREFVQFCDEGLDITTNYMDDTDMSLSAKRRGARLIYDPLICVHHFGAPRFTEAGRDDSPECIYNYSFNYTYVMLKYLPWYGKLAFIGYIFLIGQRASWGLLTILMDPLIRKKIFWRGQVSPSFRGKLAGIKTYWNYKVTKGRKDEKSS